MSSAALALSDAGPAPLAARVRAAVDGWLEGQRERLPLWLPVALGGGIAAWFIAGPNALAGLFLIALAVGLAGVVLGVGHWSGRVLLVGALAFAVGLGAIAWRSERVAAPVLERPWTGTLVARVVAVERQDARGIVRLTLADARPGTTPGREPMALPPRLRVNIAVADYRPQMAEGAALSLRARLMPPAPPSVPGAYDFARRAWFDRLGATGKALRAPQILQPAPVGAARGLRERLSSHVVDSIGGPAGGVASALATGDRSRIGDDVEEAMRVSGLSHLLSVSGLHVTAVAGAAMLIVARLAALIPFVALRWPAPLIGAVGGAAAAVGYTLLTGAEVPTVRSCIAALLVLAALALGREPLTLRLVAVGALVVLLLWPEALVGPSFQLSFAAVAAIVALHEGGMMRRWTRPEEVGLPMRLLRGLAGLLVTGLLVEAVLTPIVLFHFHRAGLYGAFANVVAIPLTTFVIMPLEALALALDIVGLGAPAWWLCGRAIDLLLWLAHTTAALPGSTRMLPAQSAWAFGLSIVAGLWLALVAGRARWLGVPVIALAALWLAISPQPDLLVTGDGRHVLVIANDGTPRLLRDRAGDYVRDTLGEIAGVDGASARPLAEAPGVRCGPDMCSFRMVREGRAFDVLLSRSPYRVPAMELAAACRRADIVVSERWLPSSCRPRWIKADRAFLARHGGLAFHLSQGRVNTVASRSEGMPWSRFEAQAALFQRRPAPPTVQQNAPKAE